MVAAFFRRSHMDFERDEKLRPGLSIALWTLVGACIVTGIPNLLLDHVVDPAASTLHFPTEWSAAVLSGAGQITTIKTPFEYVKPSELITTAACIVVGLALMRAVHPRVEALRERLTVIASGSINDYAVYLAGGVIVVVGTLTV